MCRKLDDIANRLRHRKGSRRRMFCQVYFGYESLVRLTLDLPFKPNTTVVCCSKYLERTWLIFDTS